MGIVVDKDLKEKIVGVKRLGDRIIAIKLVVGEEIIYIILAYAPQTGLVEVMKRRVVSVACLHETKWKGDKVKELADGYKLFYAGKNNTGNRVGIVVDKDMKEKIVRVKRLGDRIIAIKLVLEKDIIHIISAYAPQAGLDESVRHQF